MATVGTSVNVLVIPSSIPAKSVAEFVAYAKGNPGKLNFGFGQGTQPHLIGELTSVSYYGVLGSAGLGADVVGRINGEVNESLQSPELKASLARLGFEPKSMTPREFAALLASEMNKWAPIIKTTGFQME